jgi:hypothetical protein
MSSIFLNTSCGSGDDYFLRSVSGEPESPKGEITFVFLTNSPRPPTPFPAGPAFGESSPVILSNAPSQTKIPTCFLRSVANGSTSPRTGSKSVGDFVEKTVQHPIPKNKGTANLQDYQKLEERRGPTPIPVFS